MSAGRSSGSLTHPSFHMFSRRSLTIVRIPSNHTQKVKLALAVFSYKDTFKFSVTQ